MEMEKQSSWQRRENETWFYEEAHSRLVEGGGWKECARMQFQ